MESLFKNFNRSSNESEARGWCTNITLIYSVSPTHKQFPLTAEPKAACSECGADTQMQRAVHENRTRAVRPSQSGVEQGTTVPRHKRRQTCYWSYMINPPIVMLSIKREQSWQELLYRPNNLIDLLNYYDWLPSRSRHGQLLYFSLRMKR